MQPSSLKKKVILLKRLEISVPISLLEKRKSFHADIRKKGKLFARGKSYSSLGPHCLVNNNMYMLEGEYLVETINGLYGLPSALRKLLLIFPIIL